MSLYREMRALSEEIIQHCDNIIQINAVTNAELILARLNKNGDCFTYELDLAGKRHHLSFKRVQSSVSIEQPDMDIEIFE
jgi:hypothetical protein